MNVEALDEAIRRVHNAGAAHLPGWIDTQYCVRLIAEIDRSRTRLPMAEYHLPEEPTWMVDYHSPFLPTSCLAHLINDVGSLIRTNTARGRTGTATSLADWYPNEAVFQGYGSGGGITLHRDFSDCRLLIAVINLKGSGQWIVERSGPDWIGAGDWELGVGDLVLLRGAGFQGVNFYGRPSHGVLNCQGDRVALVLRMLKPIKPRKRVRD